MPLRRPVAEQIGAVDIGHAGLEQAGEGQITGFFKTECRQPGIRETECHRALVSALHAQIGHALDQPVAQPRANPGARPGRVLHVQKQVVALAQ